MKQTSTEPGIQKFFIEKPILQRNSLPPLRDLEQLRELHVEFAESFLLNSLGIQDWILWLSPIAKKEGVKIYLHKCPVSVVQQINLVLNFLPPNAEVQSFLVPFYSDSTDEAKLVLFEKGVHYKDGKITVPDVRDSAGEPMSMDVNSKVYFRFLGVNL